VSVSDFGRLAAVTQLVIFSGADAEAEMARAAIRIAAASIALARKCRL
jgi:hypothetical protein